MLQERFLWDAGSRYCTDGRIELFYRSFIPKQPILVVVFLHGAGQHSGQYRELGSYFFKQSIAFYALDIRGFGQSSGKRGHVQSFLEYVEDLHEFIRHVQMLHPQKPIYLLGHSLGGTIAIRYIQEYPDCIQGAVISAPALRLPSLIPKTFYFISRALSLITPGMSLNLDSFRTILANINCMKSFVCNINQRKDPLDTNLFTLRWIAEIFLHSNLAFNNANHIRISVLSICGSEDGVIDPLSVKEFHDMLDGKDKTYISFPHQKHTLLTDNQPDVCHSIVTWLKERTSSFYLRE